jgi:hypothetical protein
MRWLMACIDFICSQIEVSDDKKSFANLQQLIKKSRRLGRNLCDFAASSAAWRP